MPRFTSRRACKRFFAAYRAARDDFMQEVAQLLGQSHVVVDVGDHGPMAVSTIDRSRGTERPALGSRLPGCRRLAPQRPAQLLERRRDDRPAHDHGRDRPNRVPPVEAPKLDPSASSSSLVVHQPRRQLFEVGRRLRRRQPRIELAMVFLRNETHAAGAAIVRLTSWRLSSIASVRASFRSRWVS
jgi:hypothetical protein